MLKLKGMSYYGKEKLRVREEGSQINFFGEKAVHLSV